MKTTAFETTATVLGVPISYHLRPDTKRYTLRNNGFTGINGGNYQLIRLSNVTPRSKEGFKLKITVSKDIQTLRMSVTTANGLKAVNTFKGPRQKVNQDKLYFPMDGMISRELFERIE